MFDSFVWDIATRLPSLAYIHHTHKHIHIGTKLFSSEREATNPSPDYTHKCFVLPLSLVLFRDLEISQKVTSACLILIERIGASPARVLRRDSRSSSARIISSPTSLNVDLSEITSMSRPHQNIKTKATS